MSHSLTSSLDERPLKGVLFDLDGTLLDSAASICDSVSKALSRFNKRVAPSQVKEHLGAPLEELWELFGAAPKDYSAFRNAYIEEHDSHPERHPPALPFVIGALERFSARVPCAVATTKPSGRAAVQLQAIGIDHFFQHIQGTDEGMRHKPYPDVVLHAAKAIDIEPKHCLMVGDTTRDLGAARAAKMHAAVVAYEPKNYSAALNWQSDLLVRDLEELFRLTEGLLV